MSDTKLKQRFTSASRAPTALRPPPPPPTPTPPPRRLSPFRKLVRVFVGVCAFIVVFSVFIWLIYRPRTIQVAVDSATLSRFTLDYSTSSPQVLSFNLTAVLAISNPNKRVSIYYDMLQAEGFYQGDRFGRAAVPVSFQGVRRTDAVRSVFQGNSTVSVDVDEFNSDNSTGVFPMELWVDGAVREKFGGLMTTSASTLSVKCPLALQLTVASSRVECIVLSY